MKITDVCIQRPVLSIVLSLVLILVGLISYDRMSVRQFPRSDEPIAQITTTYLGASAALIESQVTTRIEDALAGIEGIDLMRSSSRDGVSRVTVEFVAGYDFSEGLNDMRDRLGAIRSELPIDADPPELVKADSDAESILFMSVSDPNRSAMEVTDYVDRFIKADIEQIEGVAQVVIYGERKYAMRVWLDPARMAARGVTVDDMRTSLLEQHAELPGGEIKSLARTYSVEPSTTLNSREEFNNVVIRNEEGYLVRFGDVADVAVGPENTDGAMRRNGQLTIGLGVIPQSTANPVEVAHGVKNALDRIQRSLPAGMELMLNYDKSIFIEESIKRVYVTLAEATILVILVVFLFLGTLRATAIPIVTIPVCLISVFGLMLALGYTINNLTLLALVLAIGMVVDDAIVVLENVHRHIERGMKPMQAAFKGSREIAFAIIAMTLTLVAVYAPIGFSTGFTGDLLREFAYTLGGAVLISGFVALTLTPTMCARMLTAGKGSRYVRGLDRTFAKLYADYTRVLRFFLNKRYIVVLTLLILAYVAYALFKSIPSELAPGEDQGAILGTITGPTDASFNYVDRYTREVEKIYAAVPESDGYIAAGGYPRTNQAFSVLLLKPWNERERTQQDIVKELGPVMGAIPGVIAFPINLNPLSRSGSGKPLTIILKVSGTYIELDAILDRMMALMEENANILNIERSLKLDSTQVHVEIDRDLAADLGVTIEDINMTLATMLGGSRVTEFEYDGKLYDVILQVPEEAQQNIEIIEQLYVSSEDNDTIIPLSSLVTITEIVGPNELPHHERMRSSAITANLAPGYTIGEAVEYLEQLAAEHLPDNVQYAWGGDTKRFLEASGSLAVIFLLALVFIYLVLAAQFESFVDPFIILLTVPLSIAGALFALKMTGGTLNIYSQIGLITLIGLITKHGILITEFANQLRDQGKTMIDAVIEAAILRLRPILMTTGAMVLGAMPLALSTGPGAVGRQQIGWVIVGGMTFGTLFTLVVIPVAYSLLARRKRTKIVVYDEKAEGEAAAAAGTN